MYEETYAVGDFVENGNEAAHVFRREDGIEEFPLSLVSVPYGDMSMVYPSA